MFTKEGNPCQTVTPAYYGKQVMSALSPPIPGQETEFHKKHKHVFCPTQKYAQFIADPHFNLEEEPKLVKFEIDYINAIPKVPEQLAAHELEIAAVEERANEYFKLVSTFTAAFEEAQQQLRIMKCQHEFVISEYKRYREWTEEDEEKLIELCKKYNYNWERIGKHMDRRPNDVKRHAHLVRCNIQNEFDDAYKNLNKH